MFINCNNIHPTCILLQLISTVLSYYLYLFSNIGLTFILIKCTAIPTPGLIIFYTSYFIINKIDIYISSKFSLLLASLIYNIYS